jgi:hypothetical protein
VEDDELPGPWVLDPSKPKADLDRATSFDMAAETESNVADLRRRVIPHDKLRTHLEAGRVTGGATVSSSRPTSSWWAPALADRSWPPSSLRRPASES